MQTGGYNWRGAEGSITDRVAEDMLDSEAQCGQPQPDSGECGLEGQPPCCTERNPALENLRWSAYTRPSTGLIYMQNRYYEPETGRFTQADPAQYGPEILHGQNNRWVYCANDPVNYSDPSGLWSFWGGLAGALSLVSGLVAGGVAGYLAAAGGLIIMGVSGWFSGIFAALAAIPLVGWVLIALAVIAILLILLVLYLDRQACWAQMPNDTISADLRFFG